MVSQQETDMREILTRLARIEQKLEDRDARLDKIEATQGKQSMISATIGAVATALVLLAKWLFSKGT